MCDSHILYKKNKIHRDFPPRKTQFCKIQERETNKHRQSDGRVPSSDRFYLSSEEHLSMRNKTSAEKRDDFEKLDLFIPVEMILGS